ncbi:MAG TPA: hypothetical protein VKG23_00315 [Thermoanaerobaculia bacterium]|nr:hypothetical protein [Thermoanaerobaculia bacterium]
MRLHARFYGPMALLLTAGAATLYAQQQPELTGGGLAQQPPTITRIQATAPRTTEAAPQPLGYEDEVSCFGYVGPMDEEFIASIIGAENVAEQVDFTEHNVLYLDAGYDKGIKPGDEFWIITPGDPVIHPITGATMGRFYQYRGRALTLCVEGRTAIVRVTLACTDIPMGSFLKPYEPVPIPLGRRLPSPVVCDPSSGKAHGRIVMTRDGLVTIGVGSNVMIDLGIDAGLQPGDQLSIFRYASGSDYGLRPQGSYWMYSPPPPGVVIPRTWLGDLAILYVGDRWAAARVIDSNRLIEVGDQCEVK